MPMRLRIACLVIHCFLLVTFQSTLQAQEVNGIYTDNTTKDLGDLTKFEWLKGFKIRGWVEGYYIFNFNRVDPRVANANQVNSAVRSRDLTIEGRTFDVHHNSFSLNLAEVELEKVPNRGGIGFKVDFAAGDTQDIIIDTIKATSSNGVSDFDRIFQHASISYLAPIGSGLRFDFGKFVTHIGGETIESIKNRNFSHTYYYTYGIPFQDTGLRMNYTFSPKIYAEFYLLNGWNVTSDNNGAKSYGLSLGWTPNTKFSLYANYLGGPERNNNSEDWRHLGDFQVVYSPTATLQTMINIDIGDDHEAIGPKQDAKWGGVTFYVRKSVDGRFFPTLRAEYYNDPQGFSTGAAQHVWGFTFTGDYRLGGKDDFAHVMIRPELRYDKSNIDFFSREEQFRSRKYQFTAGVGLVAYF